MELRIEGNQEELLEFRRFIYEKDNDFSVDEEYTLTEGVNKEPIVEFIIIALTKITQTLIKEYYKHKTEIEKAKISLEEGKRDSLKFSLKDGGNWRYIDYEELVENKE